MRLLAAIADVNEAVLRDLDAGDVAELRAPAPRSDRRRRRRPPSASRRMRPSAVCTRRCRHRTRRCDGCRCRRRRPRWRSVSTATAAGRLSVVLLSGPSILPGVPICSRNFAVARELQHVRVGPAGGRRRVRAAVPRGRRRAACRVRLHRRAARRSVRHRDRHAAAPRPRPPGGAGSSPARGHPDVAFRVDGDRTRRLRPLVALSRVRRSSRAPCRPRRTRG